jgi:hypothetical protein
MVKVQTSVMIFATAATGQGLLQAVKPVPYFLFAFLVLAIIISLTSLVRITLSL